MARTAATATVKAVTSPVPYTNCAPDSDAVRLWLLNRRGDRQKIVASIPLQRCPRQRFAQVPDIMAKARALLAEPGAEDEGDKFTRRRVRGQIRRSCAAGAFASAICFNDA